MKTLTGKHYGIILTVLVTAILHIVAALDTILFPHGPDPLFILNGLGYLGLLGAYFLPIPFFQQKHNLVRWGLIGFTILTIGMWIFIWVIQYVIIAGEPFFGHDSIYGVPAKIAEMLLLAFLWSDKP